MMGDKRHIWKRGSFQAFLQMSGLMAVRYSPSILPDINRFWYLGQCMPMRSHSCGFVLNSDESYREHKVLSRERVVLIDRDRLIGNIG